MQYFHYTDCKKTLPLIINSGCLITKNPYGHGNAPLLWFSANQEFEPTAIPSEFTREEYIEKYGLCRFGIDSKDSRLMNWTDAKEYANIPDDLIKGLESAGERLLAHPSNWFASSESISLSELTFQVFQGKWLTMPISEHPFV